MATVKNSVKGNGGVDNVIGKYYRDLSKLKVLDRKQEEFIAKRIYDSQNTLYDTLNTIDSDFVANSDGVHQDGDGNPTRVWDRALHMGADYLRVIRTAMEDGNLAREFLSGLRTELENKYSALAKPGKEPASEVCTFLRLIDPDFVSGYGNSEKISKKSAIRMVKDYFPILDSIIEDPETSREMLQNIEKEIDRLYSSVIRERNKMIEGNLRLVVTLAKKFQGRGVSLEDLINEGNGGLIKAAERFDYTKGFRFSTYSSWWIKHSLRRATENTSDNIRKPTHVRAVRGKISRVESEIRKLEETERVSDERIAEEMEVSLEKVRNARYLPSTTSYDRPVGDEDSTTLLDSLSDDFKDTSVQLEEQEDYKLILSIIDTLPDIEGNIIRRRFFEDHTLRQIGDDYELSRERIRQLQNQALERIRRAIKNI